MLKLGQLKLDEDIYHWIENFLQDRRQRVKVQNDLSDWTKVVSGVPQGSVLGPILFLIYINDLVSEVHYSKIALFADDAKASRPIKDKQDADRLQEDINSMVKWSDKWGLKFNPDKCKISTLETETQILHIIWK